jgi:hypothetical protein
VFTKSGGENVSDPGGWQMGYTREEWAAMATAAGFPSVRRIKIHGA